MTADKTARIHDRDPSFRRGRRRRARRAAQAAASLRRVRLSRCARPRRRVPGPRAGLRVRPPGKPDERRARGEGDEDGGRRRDRLLRDRNGGDRRGDAGAAARGRPCRLQPVPLRQHGEPVRHAGGARGRDHVRRRDGRRQRRARAEAVDAARIRRDDRQPAHAGRRPRADRGALRRARASSTSSTTR